MTSSCTRPLLRTRTRSFKSSLKCWKPIAPSICATETVRRKPTISSEIRAAIASESLGLSWKTRDASRRIQTGGLPAKFVTIGVITFRFALSTCCSPPSSCGGSTPLLATLSSAVERIRRPDRNPTPAAASVSAATMRIKWNVESCRGGALAPSDVLSSSLVVVIPGDRSPGEHVVDQLLPPRRLLNFHQASAAAVSDASLGDLVVGDRVVGGDIHRAHDTGDVQHAHFEVDPHL